ncbi:MAG: hypothetical protein IT306_10760 [Chloroflexi bacterium]|nr:hypothetical protein [Chloroflexota bacterium]
MARRALPGIAGGTLLIVVLVLGGVAVADGDLPAPPPAEQPEATPGSADERSPATGAPAPRREKLDGALAAIAETALTAGDDAALAAAQAAGLAISGGQIRVLVECVSLDLANAHAAILAAGGVVEGEYADTIQAMLLPSALDVVAGSPDVRFVRAPAGRSTDAAPLPNRGR